MRPASQGAALPIVLWALIALGALSAAAATAARLDWALARNHRDYAVGLGLAEAGLAEAMATLAADPGRGSVQDSLAGGLETGGYEARWAPVASGVRVRAVGIRGAVRREIESIVSFDATGALRIAAWREVR